MLFTQHELDEPCRWDFEAKISNKMQFEQYELHDQ